ncbi:tetratricopeptide repeat protein [Sphingomonas sp. S1-29]|uniref:SPOR domain-containing protein n=1 Tax=Sphingomonas sp. S1-29 TaxID=2991074 RepID=UPI00224055C4|nr:SPOR domain-containing protein [Sphingomonas sp. S1-29]UZK69699.1 tetratricopeptide repeat protein [Sphingomonas sp. S1-29]
MKTVTKIGLGAVATVMTVSAIGGTSMHLSAAFAGKTDSSAAARQAEKDARAAQKALGSRAFARAIGHAEQAVAMVPQDAGYRALLGQSYLSGGRFLSAAQALEEALSLDPTNGRAALNLALAQTAMGQWEGARATLASHAAYIGAADRGLALALAGDPVGAVQLLGEAARLPDADAKVRQNLALSLALSGRWMEAKTIAEIDLPAGQVQERIMQWAAFARPTTASDQVAALMGIVPVADQGRPVGLALNAPAEHLATVPQPPVVTEPADASVIEPSAVAFIDVPVPATPPGDGRMTSAARIVFAERREIVQAIPTAYASRVRMAAVRPQPRAAARAQVPARLAAAGPLRGDFFVQLGAYADAQVAQAAWSRMARRVDTLGAMTPQGASINVHARNFYRLSVGGFARADADRVCRSVRAEGGNCFVRAQAGDRMAAWAGKSQIAMR